MSSSASVQPGIIWLTLKVRGLSTPKCVLSNGLPSVVQPV